MKKLLLMLALCLLATSVARAEDEEDDPKAAKVRAAAKPKPAAPPAADKPVVKPAAPLGPSGKAGGAERSGTHAVPAASKIGNEDGPPPPVRKPAVAPPKSAEPPAKTVAHDPPVARPRPVVEPAPAKKAVPAEPATPRASALPVPPRHESLAVASPSEPATPPAPGARPVRVRLVDGSTVIGQVRAEQPESLVIDCALGQLAIPRSRIATIAYDTAAGIGQKRAPVQQLDDDLPAKKKPAP